MCALCSVQSKAFILKILMYKGYGQSWEHCGSVVECLTGDQGVAGSSLTGGTALSP